MDPPICYLYDGKEWSTTATYLTTYPFNIFVSNLEEVTEWALVRFLDD